MEAVKSKEVDNMDPLFEVLLGLVNASASTGFGFFFTPRDLYTAVRIETVSSHQSKYILCL